MSLITRLTAEETSQHVTPGACPASGKSSEIAGACGGYVYNLGAHTLSVSMDLHAGNRSRLVAALWQKHGPAIKGSFVLLAGGRTRDAIWYSTDSREPFRQESFFHWAFGVLEPNWIGGVNVDTGKSYLFMPVPKPFDYVFYGGLKTPEEYKWRYGVDEVLRVNELVELLRQTIPSRVLTLHEFGTDSCPWTRETALAGLTQFNVNNHILQTVMEDCRALKSEAEIECLRFASKVSSDALVSVMRHARPGMMEYHLEAIFKHHIYYYGGMRRTASTCVSGSGPNGAVLNYGGAMMPNDRLIRDGDMCLLAMGGEYYGYASHIAVSFPINGIFTEDQKAVYNAVLRANRSILASIRPGVPFVDMQRLAERILLEDLEKLGILTGDIEDMLRLNLAAVFMPHGVGHLIGLDVYDVGGYTDSTPRKAKLEPEGDARPMPLKDFGLALLRTARVLEPGLVLAIEPGLYFIDSLLNSALSPEDPRSKFFVPDVLQRFRGFGGVRIEDDIVVIPDGCEVLTASVPRTVAEIEAVMAEGRKQVTVSLPEPLCSGGANVASPSTTGAPTT